MSISEETLAPHSFDELALITHPILKIARVKILNFERINNRFVFRSFTFMHVAVSLMFICCIGGAISIVLALRAGNIDEAKFMAPDFSLGLIMLTRVLTLLFKEKEIVAIFNEMDRIFPHTPDLQHNMKVARLLTTLQLRFKLIFRILTMAFVLHLAYPLVKLAVHHDEYDEVALEFHQLPMWLPFGMRKSYKCYPFVVFLDTVLIIYGLSAVVEWDHIFKIVVSQLCMHFEHLHLRILELNAFHSKYGVESEELFESLKQCIIYNQRLNSLGYAFSNIFNVSLLVSDLISAAAICMHLYLVLNARDTMSLIDKLVILFLLFYLPYDTAKQGTQLQILAGDIKEALYNHNWYEGSTHYRKYVAMWMQHANKPYRLIAFETFEVNMVHFQDFVMLAYQMLAFLKLTN